MRLDDAAWASRWRHHSVAERVGLTFGLAVWGLLSPTWWVSLGIFCFVLILALLVARIPPETYLKALIAPLTFIIIGALGVVWSLADDQIPHLIRFGPLQVTSSSLETGIQLSTRAIVVTAAVVLFAATTPMSELFSALRRVGTPAVLVDIAASMYRMIFLLVQRVHAIRQAQSARLGYTSRARALRSAGILGATVFISSLDRARRLESGLTGRGGTDQLVAQTPAIPVSAGFLSLAIGANLAAGCLVWLGWWL